MSRLPRSMYEKHTLWTHRRAFLLSQSPWILLGPKHSIKVPIWIEIKKRRSEKQEAKYFSDKFPDQLLWYYCHETMYAKPKKTGHCNVDNRVIRTQQAFQM